MAEVLHTDVALVSGVHHNSLVPHTPNRKAHLIDQRQFVVSSWNTNQTGEEYFIIV